MIQGPGCTNKTSWIVIIKHTPNFDQNLKAEKTERKKQKEKNLTVEIITLKLKTMKNKTLKLYNFK